MSEAPSLADTQRWFFDALVRPGAVEGWQERLVDSPRLGARQRLAIHQRSYIHRLCRCLAEQLPALCHALGERLFTDFAREYLTTFPSQSPSLNELGARFPAWLESNRPDRHLPPEEREPWVDFMVDLARYEQALFALYDAPGHEGRPWPGPELPDAELVLQPCLGLGSYRFPVAWYYNEVRLGRASDFPPRRDEHVVIARKDFVCTTFPVQVVQHQFLGFLRQTESVETALYRVAEARQRPLAEVRRSWQQEVRQPWLAAGFFIERSQRTIPPVG